MDLFHTQSFKTQNPTLSAPYLIHPEFGKPHFIHPQIPPTQLHKIKILETN